MNLYAQQLYSFVRFLLPGFLLACLLVASRGALAQVKVTNQGKQISINGGTTLYINGSYVNTTNDSGGGIITNAGELHITQDIENNARNYVFTEPSIAPEIPPADPAGRVIFRGAGDQYIRGDSSVRFFHIGLQKPGGTVALGQTIRVFNRFQFGTGNLFLNGHDVELTERAALTGESDRSRIFGPDGFVKVRRMLDHPAGDTLNGLGLHLSAGENLSHTTILRGHAAYHAGDGSVLRYFRIIPANAGTATSLRQRYLNAERQPGMNEADFAAFYSVTNGIIWKNKGGVADTVANTVAATDFALPGNDFTAANAPVNSATVTVSENTCTTPPPVNLGPPVVYLCEGQTHLLDAGTPGLFYRWSAAAPAQTLPVDNAQTLTVTTAGTYTVRVTDAQGCTTEATVQVVVQPRPVAAFSATQVCHAAPTVFTNTSHIAAGTLSYAWRFGDGTTSTLPNPARTYAAPGTYEVFLKVTSAYGCADSVTRTVTVHPNPQPGFTAAGSCAGEAVTFTNTSAIQTAFAFPAGITTYAWNFGDGTTLSTATATHPVKVYADPGTYTVTLTTTSNAGCSQTFTHALTVHPRPLAAFTLAGACAGQAATFANTSTVPGGTATFAWDFGDGLSATGEHPVHTFDGPGTYLVTLTVTTPAGCAATFTGEVTVHPLPDVDFTFTAACAGSPVAFTGQATLAGETLAYAWDFGDGTTSDLPFPDKTYGAPGNYPVRLTVTSGAGCQVSVAKTVSISPAPLSSFSFNNACAGNAVYFVNTSTPAVGVTYAWSLGDDSTSTERHPVKVYRQPGTYQVSLTTTTAQGCTHTDTRTVTIYAKPVVDFGGTIATCGSSLVLDAGHPGSTYRWSNGATTPTITVTQGGTYSVTVTSAQGCSAGSSVLVKLNSQVAPQLGPDRTVCGATRLDAGYPGAAYRWSDGSAGRFLDVTVSGTYTVTVTDANGCTGTASVRITVNPAPAVDLGPDVTACGGTPVLLNAGNPGAAYQWSTGATGQTLSATAGGTYWVRVTDGLGCPAFDTIRVHFLPRPVVNLGADAAVCGTTWLDAGNPGATYQWSDGSTGRVLAVNGSGTYRVVVRNAAGCQAADTVNIAVLPPVQVRLGPDQTVCSGTEVLLDAGNPGSTYQWGDGTRGQTLRVASSGIYRVEVTRPDGCKGYDEVRVTVQPRPVVDLGPDQAGCDGQFAVLDAGNPGATYAWHSEKGPLGTGQTLRVTEAGRYWVRVTSSAGCVAADTVLVNPTGKSMTAVFLAASLVDVGETVQFVQLCYPNPTTFHWNFGDGVTSNRPDPAHVYYLPGTYQVSLAAGNGTCTDTLVKPVTVRPLRRTEPVAVVTDPAKTDIVRVHLYPNPNDGKFTLEVDLNQEGDLQLEVVDLRGVRHGTATAWTSQYNAAFDLSGLPPGMYLIKIAAGRRVHVKKFIKLQ